jgi:hypothetical protein
MPAPRRRYAAAVMVRALPWSRTMCKSAAWRICFAVVLGVMTLVLAGRPGAAPTAADVDVILVVDVDDVGSWLALHQEVLAAASDSARPLQVTLPARTGGRRMIALERPKFTASLGIGGGTPSVKVTIVGKVNGADALGVLTPFEQAAFEVQAGAVPNELTLLYGLSGVAGRLLELHLSRS